MLRTTGIAGLMALCPVALCALQASAEPPAARIEPWQILTIFEAGSHQFSYCVAEAQYAGGLALALQRDGDDRLQLVVDIPRPVLKIGAALPAELSVDGDFRQRVAAKATTPTSFSLAIGTEPAIAAALGHGRVLNLSAAGGSFTYDLDGAGVALVSLTRCAHDRLATLPPGPVLRILDQIASGPIQMSRAIDSPAAHGDAARPDSADEIGFAWTAEGIASAARQITTGTGGDFLDLVLGRMDRMAARCQGRLSPQLDAPIVTAGGVSEAGTAICHAPGEERFAALLFVRYGRRLLEFELETDNAGKTRAIALRDRIGSLLREEPPL